MEANLKTQEVKSLFVHWCIISLRFFIYVDTNGAKQTNRPFPSFPKPLF